MGIPCEGVYGAYGGPTEFCASFETGIAGANVKPACVISAAACSEEDTMPADAARIPTLPIGGYLPTELGILPNLLGLGLNDNGMSGTIPSQLGQLTWLAHLDLSGNSLSGTIPRELVNLAELEYLDVRNTLISGTLPSELTSIRCLRTLRAGMNHISGHIPPNLSETSLQTLDLAGWLRPDKLPGAFSGTLPAGFGQLSSSLVRLDVSSNRLSGTVPKQHGALHGLVEYNIGNQHLMQMLGPLPLVGGISGTLPAAFAALTSMTTFDARINLLSGSLPTGLVSGTNMLALQVRFNKLSGSVPTVDVAVVECGWGLVGNDYIGPPMDDNHFDCPLPRELVLSAATQATSDLHSQNSGRSCLEALSDRMGCINPSPPPASPPVLPPWLPPWPTPPPLPPQQPQPPTPPPLPTPYPPQPSPPPVAPWPTPPQQPSPPQQPLQQPPVLVYQHGATLEVTYAWVGGVLALALACCVLVAASFLRRDRRLSRQRSNLQDSRDRATFDLRLLEHAVSSRPPADAELAPSIEDGASSAFRGYNMFGAPLSSAAPGSIPPGPPSTIAPPSSVGDLEWPPPGILPGLPAGPPPRLPSGLAVGAEVEVELPPHSQPTAASAVADSVCSAGADNVCSEAQLQIAAIIAADAGFLVAVSQATDATLRGAAALATDLEAACNDLSAELVAGDNLTGTCADLSASIVADQSPGLRASICDQRASICGHHASGSGHPPFTSGRHVSAAMAEQIVADGQNGTNDELASVLYPEGAAACGLATEAKLPEATAPYDRTKPPFSDGSAGVHCYAIPDAISDKAPSSATSSAGTDAPYIAPSCLAGVQAPDIAPSSSATCALLQRPTASSVLAPFPPSSSAVAPFPPLSSALGLPFEQRCWDPSLLGAANYFSVESLAASPLGALSPFEHLFYATVGALEAFNWELARNTLRPSLDAALAAEPAARYEACAQKLFKLVNTPWLGSPSVPYALLGEITDAMSRDVPDSLQLALRQTLDERLGLMLRTSMSFYKVSGISPATACALGAHPIIPSSATAQSLGAAGFLVVAPASGAVSTHASGSGSGAGGGGSDAGGGGSGGGGGGGSRGGCGGGSGDACDDLSGGASPLSFDDSAKREAASSMTGCADGMQMELPAQPVPHRRGQRGKYRVKSVDEQLWQGAEAEGWKRHKTKHSAWTGPDGRYHESAVAARRNLKHKSGQSQGGGGMIGS